jgi:hypothetical protein
MDNRQDNLVILGISNEFNITVMSMAAMARGASFNSCIETSSGTFLTSDLEKEIPGD